MKFECQEDIKENPDISDYQELIKAAKTGRLIIFIGAGISRLIGLPSWNDFALDRLSTIYSEEFINYRTYEKLKSLDPKKLLTICEMIMKEKNITPRPAKDVFKFENEKKYKDLYSRIYSMSAIYITTNYDECLDHFALRSDFGSKAQESISGTEAIEAPKLEPNGEVIYQRADLIESKLSNGNVIHIHGSVNNEGEMLVTLNDLSIRQL